MNIKTKIKHIEIGDDFDIKIRDKKRGERQNVKLVMRKVGIKEIVEEIENQIDGQEQKILKRFVVRRHAQEEMVLLNNDFFIRGDFVHLFVIYNFKIT